MQIFSLSSQWNSNFEYRHNEWDINIIIKCKQHLLLILYAPLKCTSLKWLFAFPFLISLCRKLKLCFIFLFSFFVFSFLCWIYWIYLPSSFICAFLCWQCSFVCYCYFSCMFFYCFCFLTAPTIVLCLLLILLLLQQQLLQIVCCLCQHCL